MSVLAEYTAKPDERVLPAVLSELAKIPEVLIVLNHPFWLEEGITELHHRCALELVLRECIEWFHAFELNGTRPWRENAAVIELALELTIQHVKSRVMFGQTLFDFQNTRFKLAELATTAHIVRTFVNDCTQRLVDGTLDKEVAYMAKWWCTEQECKVVDECVQMFGGYGYMAEYPIARLYADARVQRIYGGSNEVMKDLIARSL